MGLEEATILETSRSGGNGSISISHNIMGYSVAWRLWYRLFVLTQCVYGT